MQHKVLLLRVETPAVSFRARPAYLGVDKGDSVRFINFTEAPVVLEFEQGVLEPAAGELGVNGEKEFSVVSSTRRRSPYSGKVAGATDSLEGESRPEIIIDRVVPTMGRERA